MQNETNIEYSYQIKQHTFCKYVLTTPNKEIVLSFPQMLELRHKMNVLTNYNTLHDIINNENFVLLFVADKQHLIYLDIPQLLRLKEEVGAFFKSSTPVLA